MTTLSPVPRRLQALQGGGQWFKQLRETVNAADERLTVKITVGTTEPENPSVGDIWVDTN